MRGLLTVLIGLLVLQALAYGIGFVLDPAGNAGEFGLEVSEPVDELTAELVRLVGLAMIGSAVLLILAAVLIWRADPVGSFLAMIIGAFYVVVALQAGMAGSWWDAGFYGITGVALIVLAAAVLRLRSSATPGAKQPPPQPDGP